MSKPHKGTADFIALRASAVLLLPLTAFILWSGVTLAGADYEAARAWASRPINAAAAALFVAVGAFHMRAGAAEIITDYLSGAAAGIVRLLNWLLCLIVAGTAVWAALTLAF